ncbi:MAG: hypothetical protein FWE03_07460 [Firmicutes bacterium]|nr:hypothetical protein [Bacillota bacterium]
MSIITLEQLWLNFDRKAPSKPTIVKEQYSQYIDKKIFFSGLKTDSGTTRIYARFLSYPSDFPLPVLIILAAHNQSIDDIDAHKFLSLLDGYALLFIDYHGAMQNKILYTIYPKDINTYWQQSPLSIFEHVPQDLKTSAHYYFTACTLFAINYLEEFNQELNIDINKIGILGIGTGASIVYKASIDEAIKCGASFFCGDIFGSNPQYISYKAALDSRIYAAKSNIPVLINAASNQQNEGFDYLNDLYLNALNARISTHALSSNSVSIKQRDNLKKWFDTILKNEYSIENLPKKPKISSSTSEDATYIELSGEFDSVQIYISEDRSPEFRNWKKIKHTKISETKYLIRIESNVIKYKLFASVMTKCGFSLSSEMISIKPIKQEKEQNKKGRILFKGGLSGSDWLIQAHDFFDDDNPFMTKGPFDLEGICGHELITLSSGDITNKGAPESLLQIILHVPIQTEIEFILTELNDNVQIFSHKKTISDKNWAMITLSPLDFKCTKGTPSFDKVVSIGLKADTKIIISSIIWV